MRNAWMVALATMTVALAGCADEPVVDNTPTGTDALDAYSVLAEQGVGGDTTLIGLFGHSEDTNRIPWPLGPVSSYEHMHLSSGGNKPLDQGTGKAWYAMHLQRGDEAKIVLSKVTDTVSVERAFDAEHFGWSLEWGTPAESTEEAARGTEHGGHVCQVGSFTDDWNVGSHDAWLTANADPDFANFRDTSGGQPIMVYLPRLFMHGDDCTRTTPLGFEFLPQTNVWAVILTDIGAFIQGGQFLPSVAAIIDADTGDLLEVTEFSGNWGTHVRSSGHYTYSSELPGTPATPQTFEAPFSVQEGAAGLEVAGRLLAGPDVYSDPSVTLEGPDFSETVTGDFADWSIPNPSPGAWTLTYQFTQAQPLANYEFDVNALTY